MTAPDFRRYTDLTIYDQQPGNIYSDAIEYGLTALPEFSVRQGTIEDALLQSMSYVAGQTIAAINRLPNGLMLGLLELMGFNRIESNYATGTAYFTIIDINGYTVPSNVIIGFTEEVEGGTVLHLFRTLVSATALDGESTTTSVPIQALEPGEKPPLTAGTEMTIFTNSTKLFQCFLDSDLNVGGEQETDEEYFSRASTYLGSLSSGLVTTNQINAFVATNFRQAFRSKSYDLTRFFDTTPSLLQRSSGTVTATVEAGHGIEVDEIVRVRSADSQSFNGYFTVDTVDFTEITWTQAGSDETADDPGVIESLQRVKISGDEEVGYVTLFVSGADGASLTPEEKFGIQAGLSERIVLGLQILIRDAILFNLEVQMVIKVLEGYDANVVQFAVDEYLQQILSPNEWDWNPRIRKNAIIARAAQVVGVNYIESFEFILEENEPLAEIDPITGDVIFLYKGTLPNTSVNVSVL